jgi:hypothetical protein
MEYNPFALREESNAQLKEPMIDEQKKPLTAGAILFYLICVFY